MRTERTAGELHAIDSVKKFCIANGFTVDEDVSITDRPDALLILSGRRIACECRIISPEKIMRLHGVKLREGEPYRIFLPLETHMWIRKAIEAKNPSVDAYKARANASEAWLILHAHGGFFHSLADSVGGRDFEVAKMAAHQISHLFDYILVVSSDGEVACIYSAPESAYNREKYKNQHVNKIPVQIISMGIVTATAGPDGNGVITFDMNRAHHLVKCQPLDKNFIVDYSNVDTFDYANINKDNPGPKISATRK